MSDSYKPINNGYIQILSEEGRKLYDDLSANGTLYEQLSVIFDNFARTSAKGEMATKDDIRLILESQSRLFAQIQSLNIGNTGNSSSIPNVPLVDTSDNTVTKPSESALNSTGSLLQKKKSKVSFTEMLKKNKTQL